MRTGTSTRGPITAAKIAPWLMPKAAIATAMATSKLREPGTDPCPRYAFFNASFRSYLRMDVAIIMCSSAMLHTAWSTQESMETRHGILFE